MTEKELRNLQIYIGKRNQDQTDEEVIKHIDKINNKFSISQEEWHKLIIPCCNNGMVTILHYILGHITNFSTPKELMVHTVYGRNPNLDKKRIEVLKIFINYLDNGIRKDYLSETMLHAGWFGETEIVKFLIENGADKEYQDSKDLNLEKCAQRAAALFHDTSLKEYLED